MITEAIVHTQYGEHYLKKLCRHFAHKVPATIIENKGRIEFPFGPCRVEVDSERMCFSIDVHADHDVTRAEDVVKDHLLRMANRDQPSIEWHRITQTNPNDIHQDRAIR